MQKRDYILMRLANVLISMPRVGRGETHLRNAVTLRFLRRCDRCYVLGNASSVRLQLLCGEGSSTLCLELWFVKVRNAVFVVVCEVNLVFLCWVVFVLNM